MFGQDPDQPVAVTLYTDSHVVHGSVLTRQRRLLDILNRTEERFIVLSDVTMDEWGTRGATMTSPFAQVNLAAVLFAVADTPVEPTPELRTVKVAELAFISVPPFKIVGRIHLLPERDLRDALAELTGGFVPVTEASYWSDTVGEAKQTAIMVAFNHSRAQILAPHRDVDPWAGLDRSASVDAPTKAPGRPADPT
ncbi:MAG: hypothetical protein ACYDCI_06810 [Candidatus Limnocylindrales bacterium]